MMENNKKKPLLVCQISENGLCRHDRACGPPLWAPLPSTVISRAGPREYHWCLSLCPAVLWYGSARLKRKGAECGGREQLHVCRDVRRYTEIGEALRRMDGFCWRCCCCDSQAVCKGRREESALPPRETTPVTGRGLVLLSLEALSNFCFFSPNHFLQAFCLKTFPLFFFLIRD